LFYLTKKLVEHSPFFRLTKRGGSRRFLSFSSLGADFGRISVEE